ncbi:hypothetical protein BKP35_16690 [Anaerobacillus arseniciselenatis]|uniref:Uncharacterized protein n=1 Tax=Anaerobacillus arseniciselenatis TaxID=85682 RepID=A0A1S2L9Y7_9BACI|nr:hypothetical protein [Anaerobacillus arseniciselenatis]OIJ09308.1 hypothetical protein BKP35_16690 [Anaerobacillus arseniciselenatis]
MTQPSKLLLLELIMLKEKYNQKAFSEVKQILNSEDHAILTEIIASLQALDNKNKKTPTAPKQTIITAANENVEISNEIEKLIRDKETFKRVKELQDFVSQKVKLTAKKNTKEKLIEIYFEEVSNYSEAELQKEKELLNEIKNSKQDVSAFLGMAKEIVKSRKRSDS